MTRGFLLGKFMPFHEGHLFLCDVAAGLVDELTVLVCTRECEPIDGNLRYLWVQESVKANVRVVHMHRDIPQEPSEHPDFWNIWRSAIQQLQPEPIDTVFGSEAYIVPLARELNAQPFIVDEQREIIPVSATKIRNDPSGQWQYIPKAVRPYYQKRVCMLGAESSGKSQLSQHLATHFNTSFMSEYGRTYDTMLKHGENWGAADFVNIAEGHRAIQQQVAQRSGHIYFEDTDVLQTLVWSEYLLGEVPAALQALLTDYSLADHYLLLKPNVEWLDDGTRYSGDDKVRYWFFDRLKQWLMESQCSFSVIDKTDWKAREAQAEQQVKKHDSRG